MHKYRKIIGVIISLADGHYQRKFIEGIQQQAYELNYDVLVFSSFIKSGSSSEWQYGEKNIYNIINYDLLDALIIATDTLQIPGLSQAIFDKIKADFKKPVISVEINVENMFSICTDDVTPVKKIISHIIEKHQLTDIAFVTGIKGHPHSEKRLEGYYEALIEHNLPIDKSRVFYGDFWYNCGDSIVEHLMNDVRPFPQAIACGSDTMAISVCEAVRARGMRVPEDVCVTGYDSVPAGISYYPCITSADIPSNITGERAVRYIHSKITNTRFEDSFDYSPNIRIGQSCGCGVSLGDQQNILFKKWRDEDLVLDFSSSYNQMLEGLLTESDLNKYLWTLNWYTYQIGKFSSFYLCLCENWDNLSENEKADNYLKDGYSQKMYLVLEHGATNEEEHIDTAKRFNLAEMLPNIYVKRDYPSCYIFTPVHFNERCFGYSVISYGEEIGSYDSNYRMWMKNVNSSLESLRRQRRLKMMYRRMRESATTDTMTGIYNRNGFNLYADEIFTSAKTNSKKLLVILGDLNNLKYINDNFGHIYGDMAIKSAAKAFKSASGSGRICFRFGGDEFILLDSGEYEPNQIEEITQGIHNSLKQDEKACSEKYPLDVSIGVFYGNIEKFASIEQPISIADKDMFENKQLYKKSRIK